jgi:uncharacterized protein (TIGR02145 family)
MRKIAAITMLTLLCTAAFAQQKGTFTDPRDKKTYKTVKIDVQTFKMGTQTWMAENLNYEAEGSKCYDNKPENCAKYGRLYNWATAMKACPKGWHLPSEEEYVALDIFIGGKIAGKKLKAKEGWNNGNGEDAYGFSALPGGGYFSKIGPGGYSGGNFELVGASGSWWSASEYGYLNAYYRFMSSNGDGVNWNSNDKSAFLYSVRCLQGEAPKEAPAPAKRAEDKKTYKTIKIGAQTWMAENLNYEAEGSKCYDNKPENCAKYGRLYNWATAMALPESCNYRDCFSQINTPHRGICPSGWHIPDFYKDWEVLMKFIEPSYDSKCLCDSVGTKLRSVTGWDEEKGTDKVGFSALPGGWGFSDGSFGSIGSTGEWWSAGGLRSIYASTICAYSYIRMTMISVNETDKKDLRSIRCVQDDAPKEAPAPAQPAKPAAQPAAKQAEQPKQQAANEFCTITFPKKSCIAMPKGTCKMAGGKVVDKCP